jgi:acyl homoserine lactone synthase
MWIRQYSDETISAALRAAVGRYRYRVFVESLKWELPCQPGFEQDEFDRAGATHLVAMDAEAEVVGYSRLLPTTGPYLLETHFPHLLNGLPAPCTPRVWELSRFAAMGACDAEGRARACCWPPSTT